MELVKIPDDMENISAYELEKLLAKLEKQLLYLREEGKKDGRLAIAAVYTGITINKVVLRLRILMMLN